MYIKTSCVWTQCFKNRQACALIVIEPDYKDHLCIRGIFSCSLEWSFCWGFIVFTVKPVFKTTWEIGTTWELRTTTSVPRLIQHIHVEMDLRNKTTSEFRTVFHSPWVSIIPRFHCIFHTKQNLHFRVISRGGRGRRLKKQYQCAISRGGLRTVIINWNLKHVKRAC